MTVFEIIICVLMSLITLRVLVPPSNGMSSKYKQSIRTMIENLDERANKGEEIPIRDVTYVLKRLIDLF